MSDPIRLAGAGRVEGDVVTWTIADGRRGRRWREVRSHAGAVVHALVLETDPAGRFTHLELAVAGVLLTLHPEGDGTLHGNRVDAEGGLEHIEGLPFPAGSSVAVEGSPIAAAAGARYVQGGPSSRAFVDRTGHVTVGALPPAEVNMDPSGVPHLVDGVSWPLER